MIKIEGPITRYMFYSNQGLKNSYTDYKKIIYPVDAGIYVKAITFERWLWSYV